jgi:hypothetical protein
MLNKKWISILQLVPGIFRVPRSPGYFVKMLSASGFRNLYSTMNTIKRFENYTRKNAQVVTSLQTSCYKSVHKLSTSCVHTACSSSCNKFGTSC